LLLVGDRAGRLAAKEHLMSADRATVARARRAAHRFLEAITSLAQAIDTQGSTWLISELLKWALVYEREDPKGTDAIRAVSPYLIRRRSSIVTAGEDQEEACASALLVLVAEDVRIDLMVLGVYEPLLRCVEVIPRNCLAKDFWGTLDAIDDEVCRLLGAEVPPPLIRTEGCAAPPESNPELTAALPRLAEPVLHLASVLQLPPREEEDRFKCQLDRLVDWLGYLRHVKRQRFTAELKLEYAGLDVSQGDGKSSPSAQPVEGSIYHVNGSERIWMRGGPRRLTPTLRRLLSHILANPGMHEEELLRLMGWETSSHLHRQLAELRKRLKSELRETGWTFDLRSEERHLCWKWRNATPTDRP
jgi:hypothetical protein